MAQLLSYTQQIKIYNIMKGIKITAMLLIFCQAVVVAQIKTAEEITATHIQKLDSKVTLTEEQKEKVTKVLLTSTQQIIELKESEMLTPEMRKNLKKAEREQVKEILTDEQKAVLKEAHKDKVEHKADRAMHKAERVQQNTERKAAKSALQSKRADFDVVLTADEKATIAKARTMVPAKIKGKEAREALTDEEKNTRKAQMKEVHQMLKPIVKSHEAELKEVQKSIPEKAGQTQKDGKSNKKHKKGFATRFLLMD